MAFSFEGKEYNDKEELIEFLTNHADEIDGTMIMHKDGVTRNVSFKEFIDHVGVEKAAEILSAQGSRFIQVETSKEELQEIAKRYAAGEELTLEDKEKLIAIMASQGGLSNVAQMKDELYHMVTGFIYNNHITVEKMFALLCALMPVLIIDTSDELKPIKNDLNTVHDIGKQLATDILSSWKATLKAEVSPELVALGLIFALGDTVCMDAKNLRDKRFNVEDLIHILDLDPNYFKALDEANDRAKEECDGNCAECEHHEHGAAPGLNPEKLASTIHDFFEANKPNIDPVVAGINKMASETPVAEESGVKKANPNVIDVRDRLKNQRRDV